METDRAHGLESHRRFRCKIKIKKNSFYLFCYKERGNFEFVRQRESKRDRRGGGGAER